MKVSFAILLTVGLLADVYSLPAKQGTEEVEFIPLEDQNGGGPIIVDTGVMTGPWFSPFDGLFESFAGMMARMRQQMDYLLRRLPFQNGTVENGSFPGFPNLDLDKANTTSVTKIIDGHKVVINETEYKQQGEHGGAFFKVRIIDVLPDSSELTTESNAESITTPSKEPESVEDSFENEIPKNREVETFDQVDSYQPQKIANRNREEEEPEFPQNPNWASLEPLESFEDNSIDSAYRQPDLSRDTYVNQLLADSGAPVNPDAEVFSDVEFVVPQRMGQRFEKITNPR